MLTRIIEQPVPIATPADIPGLHDADDASVERKIRSAQRRIDGPTGFLGRALGLQTLELVLADLGPQRYVDLLYPPIANTDTVTFSYRDESGASSVFAADNYSIVGNKLWLSPSASWPSLGSYPDAVAIRYEAGHDGISVADGGTGDVPDEAIEAVILMVQDMMRMNSLDAGLRSETIEGVGAMTYMDADRISAQAQTSVQGMLSGLKVYKL